MLDVWSAVVGSAIFLSDEDRSRQEYKRKYGRWPPSTRPAPPPPPPPKLSVAPSMCPSCHSRDFKYHHSRLICSYCRTGV